MHADTTVNEHFDLMKHFWMSVSEWSIRHILSGCQSANTGLLCVPLSEVFRLAGLPETVPTSLFPSSSFQGNSQCAKVQKYECGRVGGVIVRAFA